MKFIRVRGFKIFKDRHGKQRCYPANDAFRGSEE
jgi:hypothetical protein